MPKTVIVGAGIAGVCAALELAQKGERVTVLDINSEPLQGTSNNSCCRLGFGFHYAATTDKDLENIKRYFEISLKLMKEFPQFVVAHDKDINHPYRRLWYAVVQNSIFDIYHVASIHHNLRVKYKELVEQDPTNKILGEVADFSRSLASNKYNRFINADIVTHVFETAEHILNWPALRHHLINQLKNHSNISFINNTEVTSIQAGNYETGYSRYALYVTENGIKKTIPADEVICSAWENNKKLLNTAGHGMIPNSRTLRPKVIVEVELPPDFESEGDAHSVFFCFGEHMSFNIIGKGKAILSYEPITSIKEETTTALELSKNAKRLIAGQATQEEKEEFARRIINGASLYMPKLQTAKPVSTKFGVVVTDGEVNLNDPNSAVHKRSYDGIQEPEVGIVELPAMKLIYGFVGGKIARDLALSHIAQNEEIDKTIDSFAPLINMNNDLKQSLRKTVTLFSAEEKPSDSDPSVLKNKQKKNNATKATTLEHNDTKRTSKHRYFTSENLSFFSRVITSKAKLNLEFQEAYANKLLRTK